MKTKDELLDDMAELLAGLQVPRSLPQPHILLGKGLEPYDRLMDELNGFGWTDKEALRSKLGTIFDATSSA